MKLSNSPTTLQDWLGELLIAPESIVTKTLLTLEHPLCPMTRPPPLLQDWLGEIFIAPESTVTKTLGRLLKVPNIVELTVRRVLKRCSQTHFHFIPWDPVVRSTRLR